MATKEAMEITLSHKREPICCRDDHKMKFEATGISWKARNSDQKAQAIASYHCVYDGCTVRYNLAEGYFTVVNTPEHPFFIEEPGVNLLRCPKHGTWLYRQKSKNSEERYMWHCGVEGCDYSRSRRF
jgi:hypothetical protein